MRKKWPLLQDYFSDKLLCVLEQKNLCEVISNNLTWDFRLNPSISASRSTLGEGHDSATAKVNNNGVTYFISFETLSKVEIRASSMQLVENREVTT